MHSVISEVITPVFRGISVLLKRNEPKRFLRSIGIYYYSCFSFFSLNFSFVISLQVVCPDCSDDIAVKKDNILVRSFKDGKL